MSIFDHNQPKIIKVILNFLFLTRLISEYRFKLWLKKMIEDNGRKPKMDSIIVKSNYKLNVAGIKHP